MQLIIPSARAFVTRLKGVTPREVIAQLSEAAAGVLTVSSADLVERVLSRESVMPTGLGTGIAVPHARLPGASSALVAVGISEAGVDFDTPDGSAAQLIFLIVTPEEDAGAQLEILADIARTFQSATVRGEAVVARSYAEFVAAVKGYAA